MSRLDVHIIASSSKGNCITVSDGASTIMLDAGLPFSKIQRAVDLNEVECVLITHRHLDHSKSAINFLRRGFPVIMNPDTWKHIGERIGAWVTMPLEQQETDNWIILPFDVEHDVPCLGYLVESKNTGGKFVYMVDGPRINYDFTGVTAWIVEANFAKEILENGNYEEFVKDRIKRSHMSIENLVAFLKSSDLSKTEAIYLVHLSDANSHERKFIEQVQQATGVPVFTDSDFVPRKANASAL